MVQARLQYLTWAARQRLRERTVEVLETVGVTFRLPEAVELLAEAGAIVNRATSRYGSPWSPIERCAQDRGTQLLLAARDHRRDVVLGDSSICVCGSGTATCLVDDATGGRLPGAAARLRTVMCVLEALRPVRLRLAVLVRARLHGGVRQAS